MVRTPVVGVFGAPSQLGDSWVTGLSSFTEDKVNGGVYEASCARCQRGFRNTVISGLLTPGSQTQMSQNDQVLWSSQGVVNVTALRRVQKSLLPRTYALTPCTLFLS